MIVIRAPLRVSLLGGGTDFPSYYEKHGSTIISFAIDRYMHVIWNPRPTGGCRLSYSRVEELDSFADAEHTLVRAYAPYGIPEPGTLTIISDVPAGTGLGSSSALSVCLAELTRATAEVGLCMGLTSFRVEHSISGCGVQDHLPASEGGLRLYKIHPADFISMRTARLGLISQVEEYGLLLYTGRSRPASSLFSSWEEKACVLDEIKTLADVAAGRFLDMTVYTLAELTEAGFHLKTAIPGVVDEELVNQYHAAKHAGALGGKLLGAGGGGCWFFFVEPDSRQRVIDALALPEIPFGIDRRGVVRDVL